MQHTQVVYWPRGHGVCAGCGYRVRIGRIRFTMHGVDTNGIVKIEANAEDVQQLLQAIVIHKRSDARRKVPA